MIVINRANSFSNGGRIGSSKLENAIHLNKAPAVIAPMLSKIIGVVMFLSLSEMYCDGRQEEFCHKVVIMNRIEYLAVIPVAMKNKVMMIRLYGLNSDISRIRSLE